MVYVETRCLFLLRLSGISLLDLSSPFSPLLDKSAKPGRNQVKFIHPSFFFLHILFPFLPFPPFHHAVVLPIISLSTLPSFLPYLPPLLSKLPSFHSPSIIPPTPLPFLLPNSHSHSFLGATVVRLLLTLRWLAAFL